MGGYLDALKKYAVFTGRSRRKEYWGFFLVNFVIALLLDIPEALYPRSLILALLPAAYGVLTFFPWLGVTVRRLHDTNRSGAWLLIALIPIIGAIVLLVFFGQDSSPGRNQYGPNPKLD